MVSILPALREVRKDLAGLLERRTVERICRELNHTWRERQLDPFTTLQHPEELDLPDVATARFVEAEGSGQFNSEPHTIRELYRRRFEAHLQEIQGNCQARGCDWFLARTSDNPYQFLRNAFLSREDRR
jgi:hypothetical protein